MNKLTFLGSKLVLAATILLLLSGIASAAPLLSFSSVDGAFISFNGGTNTFTFVPGAGGMDFRVTLNNGDFPGGVNSLIGYLGDINGSWTIANTGDPAAVSGVGSLVIHNATQTASLTGDLEWFTIGSSGVGGTINVAGLLNYTNLVLSGVDANLETLRDFGGAKVAITFQLLAPGGTLAADGPEDCNGLIGQVRCDASSIASYSGTLEASQVPEPSTMLLSGAALLALGLFRRRIGAKA